jgi:hypothetical protein
MIERQEIGARALAIWREHRKKQACSPFSSVSIPFLTESDREREREHLR